jgi:hypothetical protein
MPKPYTLPTLVDEVKTLSITSLAGWGYLKPGSFKSGIVTWSRGERKTGIISIAVNTTTPTPYLELDYSYQGKAIRYQVALVAVPSNLGKGKVWYFLCPSTGKRCRILYEAGELFLHREAIKGGMYYKQTYSKRHRAMFIPMGKVFDLEKEYEVLYKPHFKTTYRGKPTKRYVRLLKMVKESKSLSIKSLLK